MIYSSSLMIARKIDVRQEIQTLLSGRRMEQTVMKAMPFGILLYVGVTYPGYFDMLYHNWQGVVIMTVCLAIYLGAYMVSDRILAGIAAQQERRKSGNSPPEVLKIFYPLAGCLYRMAYRHHLSIVCSRQVERDLRALYPKGQREQLCREYYVQKITLFIVLCMAGMLLGAAIIMGETAEKEKKGVLIAVGAIILAVLLFVMADRDLHSELLAKQQAMKQKYPDVVQKLQLYLGAGMTMRGALQKISPEYEQVGYLCRELQSGVSEAAAYENFGRRTGVQEYLRLSTLMAQNSKKGNSTLLERLREEADRANIEQLQSCRKLGEEASTKLLVPMVLMLLVVMLIIIIPAFSSMGL